MGSAELVDGCPPSIVSLPALPRIKSLPDEPVMVSFPDPPSISAIPVTALFRERGNRDQSDRGASRSVRPTGSPELWMHARQ